MELRFTMENYGTKEKKLWYYGYQILRNFDL